MVLLLCEWCYRCVNGVYRCVNAVYLCVNAVYLCVNAVHCCETAVYSVFSIQSRQPWAPFV